MPLVTNTRRAKALKRQQGPVGNVERLQCSGTVSQAVTVAQHCSEVSGKVYNGLSL